MLNPYARYNITALTNPGVLDDFAVVAPERRATIRPYLRPVLCTNGAQNVHELVSHFLQPHKP